MIELDSLRWSEFRHAYGPAADIPDLLRQASRVPADRTATEGPWFALWSALCHQFDVYSASIAAVPHLVAIAADRPPAARVDPLALAGAIETYRHRPGGPTVPSELIASHAAAISRAAVLTAEALSASPEDCGALLSALAAFQGQPQLAAAIAGLEQRSVCPACDHQFVTPGYDLFESVRGAA